MISTSQWQQNLKQLGRSEEFRATVGLILSVVTLALLIVVMPVRYMFYAFEPFQIFVVLISFGMITASTVLIWKKPGDALGRMLLIAGIAIIIPLAAYYNGGLSAPAVPLTMLLPLLTLFLLGRTSAVIVLLLALSMFTLIYFSRLLGAIPESVVAEGVLRERTRLLVFSAITVLAYAIGSVYEVYRQRLQASEILTTEQDAIKTMVVTYNHEINNPLMIAMMQLDSIAQKGSVDLETIEKIRASLVRIEGVTRKIRDLSQSGEIQKDVYHGDLKVLKIS